MWQVLSGGWQALVRLGASAILARALVPGDFGLFGMSLLIIELVDYLGGLGMTGGLIAKKEIGDKELNTCFWTMAGVRFLLFCIAFTTAPFAAIIMKEPRIEAIVKVVSFTFIFSIFGIIGNTILSRKMMFGKISVINAILILFESSLAVYLTKTTNLGYWALVYPMLVTSLLYNVSVFIAAKWFPRFTFDKESFRFLFRFGIHGLGFNIANYLFHNLDYFIVGRVMGTTSLGLYEYAFRIPHIVLDRLARPVGAVVFPALAKVQNDDEAIIRGFIETVKYVTVVAFPLLGGLAALAEPLVLVLWGEQWRSIILPLQILCLCSALRCSVQPIGAIFLCKHRPEIQFKQSVLSLIATAALVGLGIWFFGLVGVALGMTIATGSYVYSIYHAFALTKRPAASFFWALVPSAISAVVSSSLAYFCMMLLNDNVVMLSGLLCSVLIGVLGYIGCYYFFFKDNLLVMWEFSVSLIMKKKTA